MSDRLLKYLTIIIFLAALLVWAGAGYLYFTKDSLHLTSFSLGPFSLSVSPAPSYSVFTDEENLFSLRYDSQKYSIEKQIIEPTTSRGVLPTNLPGEILQKFTLHRLVDRSNGKEVFSFRVEEIPYQQKIALLGQDRQLFVNQEISNFYLHTIQGSVVKRLVSIPAPPSPTDPFINTKKREFILYTYFLPINGQSERTLIIVTSPTEKSKTEEIIKGFRL